LSSEIVDNARFAAIVTNTAGYVLIKAVQAAVDVMLYTCLASQLEESDAPVCLRYLADTEA